MTRHRADILHARALSKRPIHLESITSGRGRSSPPLIFPKLDHHPERTDIQPENCARFCGSLAVLTHISQTDLIRFPGETSERNNSVFSSSLSQFVSCLFPHNAYQSATKFYQHPKKVNFRPDNRAHTWFSSHFDPSKLRRLDKVPLENK